MYIALYLLLINMRPLKIDDYNRIVSVVDPQLSPDGKYVAFVTVTVDSHEDDYKMNIWIMDVESGETVLTTGGFKDNWPRWSPDGKKILFLSRRILGKGEPGNELWILPLKGGEPRLLFKSEKGIVQPSWSPDGRKIIFLSRVVEEGYDDEARLINRIPIWFNGMGFIHQYRMHLFEIDIYTGLVKQLTDGDFDVLSAKYSWSGKYIAYAVKPDDLKPRKNFIHVIDVGKGKSRRIMSKGMMVGPMVWSKDEAYIFFRGNDYVRGYATHEGIWRLNLTNGEVENLTSRTGYETAMRVYYDVRGPYSSPQPPVIDGGYLYFILEKHGRENIYRMNLKNEEIEAVLCGDFIIDNFQVKDGKIVYAKIDEKTPAEIYVLEKGYERKLTSFNEDFLNEVKIQSHERFEFKASDGAVVEGWIMKPAEFREGEKYPAIIFIHGGPKSVYGYAFMFEHQIHAAKGYVVIYGNIRGSGSYSEDFADIRGHYGERDYKDVLEMVDYIVKNYSFIDETRLGVTGLSYGGFMTNWIVTHTDKFKAAVSLNGISSWLAEFGTTDIGFHFVPDQIGGDWWTNREKWIEKSPITYASNVKTPILIIHSMEDYRCYLDQALLFYTALKYLGKEVKLLLFTRGAHAFSRHGKPSHRIKRLKYTLEWFDKHLK